MMVTRVAKKSLSLSYDQILYSSLRFYFKLLNRKIQASGETVFFKEAEMLETEWEFLSGICHDIIDGCVETAEQFW